MERLTWQVEPGYREQLLGPEGLRLDEWLRDGQARVVKQGPHRTVYAVVLPGLKFHVKHCPLSDARAWLRQLVRPAKARMEYERALAVAARGVPTFTPLGLGEPATGSGPSVLLTRSLDGTEPLNTFIETTIHGVEPRRQVRVRLRLAGALAEMLARMHQAGVIHNDLHPGNLLIRLRPDERIELFLIDLHAVQLGPPLDWHARRANLVILNRWFVLRVERAERRRFWREYCRAWKPSESDARSSRTDEQEMALELEQATWDSNLCFWRGRDRRCLVTNRYYERVGSAVAAGHAVRELDRAALKLLLADPDEPFRRPGVVCLKDSRSSTVVEFDLPVHGVTRRVVYKRFRVRSWSEPWLALVRRSAALRSWVFGHGLRERGLPTARPLVVLQRRRRGLAHEGYLLTEKVPDAVDLRRYLANLESLSTAERRPVVRRQLDQVARLVRELHRRRLSQRDLKAANILMSPARCSWSVMRVAPVDHVAWLIDLVGMTRHRNLSRQRRVRDLTRLHASFHDSPLLTRTDKLRFLQAYLQWGLFDKYGWKRWWRNIEKATADKIARNRETGRPLA